MTNTPLINAALTALGDPTRRAILQQLRAGAMTVSNLAETLPISRPAVSQHLRVLIDAGLLTVTPQANRRLYRLAPQGLTALREHLDAVLHDAIVNGTTISQA